MEVAPKVGKPVTVTSKDGKPGVVVVTREFSFVKRAITSMVLAGVVGLIIWFAKRKKKR